MLIAVVILGRFSIGLGRACGAPKAIARAHGQQMSSDLIVRLRDCSEPSRNTSVRPGKGAVTSHFCRISRVWPCGRVANMPYLTRHHAPISSLTTRFFFSFFQNSCKISGLTEYERNPMLISPSPRFPHLESVLCHVLALVLPTLTGVLSKPR